MNNMPSLSFSRAVTQQMTENAIRIINKPCCVCNTYIMTKQIDDSLLANDAEMMQLSLCGSYYIHLDELLLAMLKVFEYLSYCGHHTAFTTEILSQQF